MRTKLTEELARAAANDAGNASMRRAGRKHWSEEDAYAASRAFFRLKPFFPTEARLRLTGNAEGRV